jgi:hypothetical protein
MLCSAFGAESAFADERGIAPGGSFPDDIAAALDRATVMVE